MAILILESYLDLLSNGMDSGLFSAFGHHWPDNLTNNGTEIAFTNWSAKLDRLKSEPQDLD